MRFHNEVVIDSGPAETYRLVTDIQRVADSLPGASLVSSNGDQHEGVLAVKVGPITASYEGTITFVENDEDARNAVLLARAADSRGAGSADARITLRVEDVEGRSRIVVDTDAQIRGRVAQLGRGAMEKVGAKLFEAFAANLQNQLQGAGGSAGGAIPGVAAPGIASSGARQAGGSVAPAPAAVLDAGQMLGIAKPPKEILAFLAGVYVGLSVRAIIRDLRS